MKKKNKCAAVLVSCSLFVSAGFLAACNTSKIEKGKTAVKEFSADIITKTKNKVFRGKIFVSKDKVRIETPEATKITRIDQNAEYTLLPKEKSYIKHVLKAESSMIALDRFPNETQRVLLGSEVVGGATANKYKVSYSVNGKEQTVYQWIGADTGVPLKITSQDGTIMHQFENITTGTNSPDIYEIPSGYQDVSPRSFNW